MILLNYFSKLNSTQNEKGDQASVIANTLDNNKKSKDSPSSPNSRQTNLSSNVKNSNNSNSEEISSTNVLNKSKNKRHPSDSGYSLENYFNANYPGVSWKFNRNSDGKIISIWGGIIANVYNDPEKLNALIKSIEQSYNLGTNSNIDVNSEKITTNPDESTKIYTQKYKNYEVFGSFIKISARNSDHAIYFINLELNPIHSLNEEVNLSNEQALNSLLQRIPTNRNAKIKSDNNSLIVYSSQANSGELVWSFQVSLSNPRDDRLILVSATTGEKLFDVPQLKH